MLSNKKSAAIGFIFITMLIDITGWGIIIPVIPKLIKDGKLIPLYEFNRHKEQAYKTLL